MALKIYPKARGICTELQCSVSRRELIGRDCATQKSLSELNVLQVKREQQIHGCANAYAASMQSCFDAAAITRSRLHHANVLELYAVFEDFEAYYFVMQCVLACKPLCISCLTPVLRQIRSARRSVSRAQALRWMLLRAVRGLQSSAAGIRPCILCADLRRTQARHSRCDLPNAVRAGLHAQREHHPPRCQAREHACR